MDRSKPLASLKLIQGERAVDIKPSPNLQGFYYMKFEPYSRTQTAVDYDAFSSQSLELMLQDLKRWLIEGELPEGWPRPMHHSQTLAQENDD